MEINIRRELITAIFSGWLIGATGGTFLAICTKAILSFSAFWLVLLPLAIPFAIVFSAVPFVLGLAMVALMPRLIARNRKAICIGFPLVLTLACTGSRFAMFVFVDSVIAAWWCYRLTEHLAEEA